MIVTSRSAASTPELRARHFAARMPPKPQPMISTCARAIAPDDSDDETMSAGWPTSLATFQHASRVHRLGGVLDVVVGDADQPHAERHRRVPALVDDAVELGRCQSFEQAAGRH